MVSDAQKLANKLYRERNRERYNELQRIYNKNYHLSSDKYKESNKQHCKEYQERTNYYENNKDRILLQKKEYYRRKKEEKLNNQIQII
jgi:hypothetical protein